VLKSWFIHLPYTSPVPYR